MIKGDIIMSEFLFGDFYSKHLEKEQVIATKAYFLKRDAFIWFDNEITFHNNTESYGSIQQMLHENPSENNNHTFFITTKTQPDNSYDLLYPWDKYKVAEKNSDDTLKEKTDEELCDNNLNILHNLLLHFIENVQPKSMRVFVVVGYDPEFQNEKFRIDEMIDDLKRQVKEDGSLDSVIYEIIEEV